MDHQITVLFNSMINQDSGSQLDGLHQYLSRQRCFQGIVLGLIRVRECRPSRMIDKKQTILELRPRKRLYAKRHDVQARGWTLRRNRRGYKF